MSTEFSSLLIVAVYPSPVRLGNTHGQETIRDPLGRDGAGQRCTTRFGAAGFQSSVVVGVVGDQPLGIGFSQDLTTVVVGVAGVTGRTVGRRVALN